MRETKIRLQQLKGCEGCILAKREEKDKVTGEIVLIKEKCVYGGLVVGRSDYSVTFSCNRG